MIDDVNNPEHYNKTRKETIETIEDSMLGDEFEGYLKGNILKYVTRYRFKHEEDPLKDLCKARWYLNKLIEVVDAKT
jgi:hypothetical protein